MIVTVEFVHKKGKNGGPADQDVIPLGTLEEGTVTSHSQTNSKRDMSKVNLTENGKNLVFYDEVLLPFENVYCMQLYCMITTSLHPKRKVAPATVSYATQ